MTTVPALVRELETLKDGYGPGLGPRKEALVRRIGALRLPSADLVRRYHDALCFLRALPDDASLLAAVEEQLAAFSRRRDLRRFRAALADTGIAGTSTYYRFLLPMALWLARRHPGALHVDWSYTGDADALEALLPLVTPRATHSAFDEYSQPPRFWMKQLVGSGHADGEWLAARFSSVPSRDPAVRDALWASVQAGFRLAWSEGGPSRTTARHAPSPVVFVRAPLDGARPDILKELNRPPRAVRKLARGEASRVLDLAREAMVVRHRDLDAFSHGNPEDVRMVELGDGLQLACVGMLPEKRLLLEAVFGFLTLRNGVPVGYVLTSALFNSSEVAYNVFDTWRGGESGRIYGRVLAAAAHLFGSDTFAVDPYQLGHENDEGLASGAWWFYQKLGFRPKDPGILALMERELRRMAANPRHRSDRATLRRLVPAPMFFHAGAPREDVLGRLSVADVGAAIMRTLADGIPGRSVPADAACSREAMRLLGVPPVRGAAAPRGWTGDERAALRHWSPLVLALTDVERWSARDRAALLAVIRAKGGPDELGFVRRFNAHRRLRAAIVELQRARLAAG